MRVVIASCSVDYSGRLDAHLPRAKRLIVVKADGSVLVHSDGGSYKPLNWMSPPARLEEVCPDEEDLVAGVVSRWEVSATKTDDRLVIRLFDIMEDSSVDLGVDPGLTKDGVEAHLQELLAEQVEVLGAGWRLVRREYPTPVGPVDLLVRDDQGNRVNRKNAKTKYTLERVGVEAFKAEVENRAGIPFAESRPYEFTSRGDRFGWVEGIDGKHHLTLFIENGRLLDFPGKPLKTGMLEIAKIHQGDFRLTANQNLIIAGVPAGEKARIEALARQYGLLDDGVSEQRKQSMACVALPTCPLAMAEAERMLPAFVTDIEGLLTKHGLADDAIIFRVTGCPNGCGRAMLAEVGLVGKAPGRYNLHLGGNLEGTRIPRLYQENITEPQILAELDRLIGRWAAERTAAECFGDFVIRTGVVAPVIDSARDFYAA